VIGLSIVEKNGTLKTPSAKGIPGLLVVGKDGTVRLSLTTSLEDGAVTEAKIAPGAVTETKIGAGAVNQGHLQPDIVGADQLAHSVNATGIGFNADMVDGQHAAEFAGAGHEHDTDYAPLSHPHDGANITTGKINNLRLNTGTGNGLDADTVDGQHAAAFAGATHNHDASYAPTTHPHDGADVTTGKIANARLNTGAGNGLDADTVDGAQTSVSAVADTIPIRDSFGKVVGNISGNAGQVDWIHASATPTANFLLPLDENSKLPASITGDADTVDGQHAAAFAGAVHNHDAAYAPTTHPHGGADITTGTIDNARLNMGAGNGLDADKVDGYQTNTGAVASTIPVRDASARVPGNITGNANQVDWIHASATPTANYLLPLDASLKLPASITGDADTVDGQHAADLGGVGITPYRQYSIVEYSTTNTTPHDLPGCYMDITVQAGDIVVMWATFRHAISSARGAAVKYKARIGETYSVTQEVGNAFSNSFIGAAVNLVDTITVGGTIRVGVQFAGCSTTQTVYARDMELSILVIR
jgi:hypothetical protein